jgi:hypothetical protein
MRAIAVALSGSLKVRRIPCPKAPLAWRVRNFLRYRLPDWPRLGVAHVATWCGVPTMISRLYVKVRRADGRWEDFGLVSTRVVTDAGATAIVDNFRGAVANIASFKFHGIGTGSTAEAATDTALVTECTTALNPDNTRATGSQGNNGAKVYRTVGLNTVDAGVVVTEQGLFTQAATGGGTLLDRSIFGGITLVAGDAFQSTYDLTVNSGG